MKRVYGGVVLTGPPTLTPCKDKVCALGDAAGLNKPLTGGGLYPTTAVVKRFNEVETFHKAYHPLVERLVLETLIARAIHKAPQRVYEKAFAELDGVELRVSEYDNHLRTLKEIGGKRLVSILMRALKALIVP